MANERYASIWDALKDTPEQAENMRLRSELMRKLRNRVKSWSLTQKEAAKRLHVTQPRLNDMLNGRIEKFTIDALVNMTVAANMKIDLNVIDEEVTA